MISKITKDSSISLELRKIFYGLRLSRQETADLTSLMITSAEEGEGKSILSLSFALGLSLEKDQKCLLVDANWMKPVLHEWFGMERHSDLKEFWQKPEECIQTSCFNNLDVLVAPRGVEVDSQEEFIERDIVAEVFLQLTRRYKTVIFDTSSINLNMEKWH